MTQPALKEKPVKETGIIFSGEMVRAILEGRKTMTRRILKRQPQEGHWKKMPGFKETWARHGACWRFDESIPQNREEPFWITCPFGQPGDRLWLRETWRVGAWAEENGLIAIDYKADNFARKKWLELPDDDYGEKFNKLWEQSCEDASNAGSRLGQDERYHWKPGESPCRWRSPYHMPRWASRLTLEITDIRVERLQDISEDNARAEGVECHYDDGVPYYGPLNHGHCSAIYEFRRLWNSIHGEGAWDLNPWVFVISFQKL